MTNFDIEYLKLVREILSKGFEGENRTGINTINIPYWNFSFDLAKEFPILESKSVVMRNALTEMLWIYQAQSNDVSWLTERGNHIWDEWKIDADGIYRVYEPSSEYIPDKKVPIVDTRKITDDDPFGKRNGFEYLKTKSGELKMTGSLIEGKTIRSAKYFGKKYAGTIGTAYGYIVRKYKLIDNLIYTLKNEPTDRRKFMSLWQNSELKTAVLPSCVWSSTWDVTNNKLNAVVNQRSCDVPLGLPFNVSQYAALVMLLAHFTGLEPGNLVFSIQNPHIYVNQLDGINIQLSRQDVYNRYKSMPEQELRNLLRLLKEKKVDEQFDPHVDNETLSKILDIILNPTQPSLWIDSNAETFYDVDNTIETVDGKKEVKGIKVKNYKNMGTIKFPIAQ